jgi:tartrate-resistant acid phosphatase type 5
MRGNHFEQFVHLADLTHEHALIAWGGFFFDPPSRDAGARIVEDDEVSEVVGQGGRDETIGAASPPFGRAEVEVLDAATDEIVATATTSDRNHVWVAGLDPDTEYRYRVHVDGTPWGEKATYDWVHEDGRADLVRTDRAYDLRFRTFPAPDRSAPLRFAVLGDYGVGIRASDGNGLRQLRLADGLDRAVRFAGVRLVLTTGDNVYIGEEDSVDGTGDEDDDWYYSFYQPYRYVIAQVPVYPGVGNHDTGESEISDNRDQLADNFFTDLRFGADVEHRRASVDPGLYYRFSYGADVEFVCIDTTEAEEVDGYRYFFDIPRHRAFLEESFPDDAAPGTWRIPFTHHPPFCAGPKHHDLQPLADLLVPLLHRSGVQLVLSGHEHNFQHQHRDGVDYLITGASGKLREDRPDRLLETGNRSWAAEGHFLVVDVDPHRIVVHPVTDVDEDGRFVYLRRQSPDGRDVSGPIVIERHGDGTGGVDDGSSP